ncbi:MAG: GHKL domain-containing protein [Eubacterium sp.]|nr:GHKL domain-containing protein [Eubacterium sp.]
MSKEEIINIATNGMSVINFIMVMLIIVMISACFLGRYVVLSRKMIITTLGVLVVYIVFIFVTDIILQKLYPVEVAKLEELQETNPNVVISLDDPEFSAVSNVKALLNVLINGVCFLYAFIFFLFVYKEKKLLRAIEAFICLYLFYFYVNSTIEYAFIYLSGGGQDVLMSLTENAIGGTFDYLSKIIVFVSAFIDIALFLILYLGYYKKKKFYVIKVRDRIFFVLWLVIFNAFPAIPLITDVVEDQYRYISYVFGIIIILIGVIGPILVVMIAASRFMKEKNEYQESYLKAELEYIEQYKRTQNETRAFRHDIINNLSLTNMMLDEGNVDGASSHLKQLLGNVKALSPSIITGDEMLDCIVSMKADKMLEKGIDFSMDGVIDGGLGMTPMDVCSIFANALDNAIEASSKVLEEEKGIVKNKNEMTGLLNGVGAKTEVLKAARDTGGSDQALDQALNQEADKISDKTSEEIFENENSSEKKAWVNLFIKRTEKFFVIRISNSAKEMVNVEKLLMSSGYTSKKDKDHHGFGLRNINDSVEKYDGLLKAESDDSSFTLSIMVPRKAA